MEPAPDLAPPAAAAVLHLHRGGTSVVIDLSAGPTIVHWGPQVDGDASSLASLCIAAYAFLAAEQLAHFPPEPLAFLRPAPLPKGFRPRGAPGPA